MKTIVLYIDCFLTFWFFWVKPKEHKNKQLPGVTEDIKWGSDLCFSVGGKMFLVTALEQSPITASFTDEQFEELSAKPGFKPARYMANHLS